MKIKKWFTLVSVIIYMIIMTVIIIPTIVYILSLLQYIIWWFYLQNTLSYISNFVDNRESQIIYIKNSNQIFWKVFSSNTIYGKQYWDNITENDIKSFPFYTYIQKEYKLFQNKKNIKINYLNVSKTFIWINNINYIRNVIISWVYKNHRWFICKYWATFNDNNQLITKKTTCNYWIRLYVQKKIKDNVYKTNFIYKNWNFTRTFFIVNDITNKRNTF